MTDLVEVYVEPDPIVIEVVGEGPQGPSPTRSLYDAVTVSPIGGVLTIDCEDGTSFLVNLSESVTRIDLLNVPDTTHSQGVELYFRQPSGGGKTVTGWPGSYWPSGAIPAVSVASGAVDVFVVKSAFGILFTTLVAPNWQFVA